MSETPVIYVAKRINGAPRVFRGFAVNNTLQKVRALSPIQSQKIYNHSPDGFEWGYGGSGPAQLALAIMLDYTGNRKISEFLYQRFKWIFIATANKDGWQIKSSEIDAFLDEHKDLTAHL